MNEFVGKRYYARRWPVCGTRRAGSCRRCRTGTAARRCQPPEKAGAASSSSTAGECVSPQANAEHHRLPQQRPDKFGRIRQRAEGHLPLAPLLRRT